MFAVGEASTHCFVPWKTKYADMLEGFIDSISKSAIEVGRVFKTSPCNVKINIATQLTSYNTTSLSPLLFVYELGGMIFLFLLAELLNTFFSSNVVNNELKKI